MENFFGRTMDFSYSIDPQLYIVSKDYIWNNVLTRNIFYNSYKFIGIGQELNGMLGFFDEVNEKGFGQGAGTMLLPGGYTSPERFVKAAYEKTHVRAPKNSIETMITCFHIMESVSIPKGIVVSDRDTYDYTKYTAFINTNTCEYFIKTYDNNQILTASLWDNYEYNTHPICLGKLNRPFKFESL